MAALSVSMSVFISPCICEKGEAAMLITRSGHKADNLIHRTYRIKPVFSISREYRLLVPQVLTNGNCNIETLIMYQAEFSILLEIPVFIENIIGGQQGFVNNLLHSTIGHKIGRIEQILSLWDSDLPRVPRQWQQYHDIRRNLLNARLHIFQQNAYIPADHAGDNRIQPSSEKTTSAAFSCLAFRMALIIFSTFSSNAPMV